MEEQEIMDSHENEEWVSILTPEREIEIETAAKNKFTRAEQNTTSRTMYNLHVDCLRDKGFPS